MMIGALRCLKRVEDFLTVSPQHDARVLRGDYSVEPATATSVADVPGVGNTFELRNRKTPIGIWNEGTNDNSAFVVQEATLAWPGHSPVIRNIDLKIPKSRLTIIIGPNVSGKTTLCKALLGETDIVAGSVYLNASPDIAVCNQQTFLFNASLRENIIAFSNYDAS